jgi:hypothetical protein
LIFDKTEQLAVDSLGWIDQSSLWVYSVADQTERRLAVPGAHHLTVRKGLNGLFRVTHHESEDCLISIRRFSDPGTDAAALHSKNGAMRLSGDRSLWQSVETMAIVGTASRQMLLRVDEAAESALEIDLDWYLNGNYDLGYQGLVDCLTLRSEGHAIVAVQRSSELVILDLQQNAKIGSIELAGRGGNPKLAMRSTNELVASDYDALCLVDVGKRELLASAVLQAPEGAMHKFIGDYDLNANGTCAVARTFSSDVVLVDSKTFEVIESARMEGQPLGVCMTSESSVITRDWHSGKISEAVFQSP